MRPVKILIRLREYVFRSDFCWAQMTNGTFSDVAAQARSITKTYLYNFDPLKPHFYTVNLEFTGAYIVFLISAQKHRLWVLVRTASSRRF